MGQGGHLTFVNSTPYDWKLGGSHYYQMNAWSFPGVIPAGTRTRLYIEWNEGFFNHHEDDAGEVNYSVSNWNFQLQARWRHLQIYLQDMHAELHPSGSIIDLGWNGEMFFHLISGADGNFFICTDAISFSFADGNFTASPERIGWMQANLTLLGSRTLREICILGSHDAGMSEYGVHTDYGYECNTRTQCVNIRAQLKLGSRYFDIRLVISGGNFYAGHYGEIGAVGRQGANGQSMPDIIQQVNEFTSKYQELIILDLSHACNTDSKSDVYQPFTEAEWKKLLALLMSINNRSIQANPHTVDLTGLKLDQYIGGRASVIIVIDPQDDFSLDEFENSGIYFKKNYPRYDSYSDTNDVYKMRLDQLEKMKSYKKNPTDSYFVLSWTLTQSTEQATYYPVSILELAKKANNQIASIPEECTQLCYPNVLSIDGIETFDPLDVVMSINRNAKP